MCQTQPQIRADLLIFSASKAFHFPPPFFIKQHCFCNPCLCRRLSSTLPLLSFPQYAAVCTVASVAIARLWVQKNRMTVFAWTQMIDKQLDVQWWWWTGNWKSVKHTGVAPLDELSLSTGLISRITPGHSLMLSWWSHHLNFTKNNAITSSI